MIDQDTALVDSLTETMDEEAVERVAEPACLETQQLDETSSVSELVQTENATTASSSSSSASSITGTLPDEVTTTSTTQNGIRVDEHAVIMTSEKKEQPTPTSHQQADATGKPVCTTDAALKQSNNTSFGNLYKLNIQHLEDGNYHIWNWDSISLSKRMIYYAALDAVAGLRVFEGILWNRVRPDYRPLAEREPRAAAEVVQQIREVILLATVNSTRQVYRGIAQAWMEHPHLIPLQSDGTPMQLEQIDDAFVNQLLNRPEEERCLYWTKGVPPYATGLYLHYTATTAFSWWTRAYPRVVRHRWAEEILRQMTTTGDLVTWTIPPTTEKGALIPYTPSMLTNSWHCQLRFRLGYPHPMTNITRPLQSRRFPRFNDTAMTTTIVKTSTSHIGTENGRPHIDTATLMATDHGRCIETEADDTSSQTPLKTETAKSDLLSVDVDTSDEDTSTQAGKPIETFGQATLDTPPIEVGKQAVPDTTIHVAPKDNVTLPTNEKDTLSNVSSVADPMSQFDEARKQAITASSEADASSVIQQAMQAYQHRESDGRINLLDDTV
jgi:hypothetical protein